MGPTPLNRPIRHYRILERARTHLHGLSGRADFTLAFNGRLRNVQPVRAAIPYCADLQAENLLFVTVDDAMRTLRAPFAYRSLYDDARALIACPIERTAELEMDVAGQTLLIFSIGRCGSTLLSTLLNQTGHLSISEPDALCGFAFLKPSQVPEIGLDVIGAAMHASLASFHAHARSAVAIKFRSQCNRAVDLYRRLLPDARIAFVLRETPSWAASVHRAFGEPPEVMVRRLSDGLAAYDRLVEGGAAPALVWYEDLRAEPQRAIEALIGRALGPEEAAAVGAAAEQDSQAGTGLDRSIVRRRPLDEAVLSEFRRAWSEAAPRALIEKHGLERLG